MSFIWNWWSGKKEDEDEEKDKTKDKKEEKESEEIEKDEEVEKDEEGEKGETIEKEEKETIEIKEIKEEKEEKDENEGHQKISSLSGVSNELEEGDNKEKEKIEELKEKEDNLKNNQDENDTIKVSLQVSDEKKKNVPEDLSINKDDPLHWKSMIYGPENSPYENGKFEVSINFEENNPKERPKIKFLTKIYHYNVEQNNGEVLCPFIWNTTSSEEENLKKIKLLMNAPDSRFPWSKFIQEEYYNNFPRYKEKALKFTEDYAMS